MSTADERERRRKQAEADHAADETGIPRIGKPREQRTPVARPAKGYLRDRRFLRSTPSPVAEEDDA